MKKLLKKYGLNSDMQYFEMIVESVINGQRTQAKELFTSITKSERKSFVKAICFEWQTGLETDDKEMFIDLI
jgi:hypothetical protein